MPIGITTEHEDLRRTVRRWLETYCPPAVPRAALEAAPDELPPIWTAFAEQGWLGLHVAEDHGGQGFGLPELAVVLEELGRSLMPGPVLPTALVSSALAASGNRAAQAAHLPGLAAGRTPAGVHLGPGALEVVGERDGRTVVSGELRPVLGAPTARLVLAPVAGVGWCVVDTTADGVAVDPLPALDPTRPLGAVRVAGAALGAEQLLSDLAGETVRGLALVLGAAESAGAARWCLETASQYATVRVQFGRPIGQFQAVKHRLADMLVAVEQADAVAWDAAQAWTVPAGDLAGSQAQTQALAAGVAGSVAVEGFVDCAKACVQILGGIGFTWEHDAHLYLRRAMATRQLLGGTATWRRQVAELALGGARRPLGADLPPEAETVRAEIAPLVAEAASLAGAAQRKFLVDTGLSAPHWPKPWGRDAPPLEQLVIDEELAAAAVVRPGIGVGAWALPTLIAHGSPEQQERWVRPTLLGELAWCQLFSEPGAGSDLASLSTRAERVEGGWRLTGQKVWTSLAHVADWGICLARSDPSAPKHEGITYFVVDMKSDGVEVRPLRELTGAAMFNEVFLTDVFVPDDCVVGAPGAGWRIGRTTLTNERVSLSSGATFGVGVESVLRQLERLRRPGGPGRPDPPGGTGGPGGPDEVVPPDALDEVVPSDALVEVGALLAEAQSLQLLGHRTTLRSLSGTDPGAGSSVRKLLAAEHEQRVQELGLSLQGAEGAVVGGRSERWVQGFLATRCLTIAGGTSEVQRNVMAERILGQPRDPEPGS